MKNETRDIASMFDDDDDYDGYSDSDDDGDDVDESDSSMINLKNKSKATKKVKEATKTDKAATHSGGVVGIESLFGDDDSDYDSDQSDFDGNKDDSDDERDVVMLKPFALDEEDLLQAEIDSEAMDRGIDPEDIDEHLSGDYGVEDDFELYDAEEHMRQIVEEQERRKERMKWRRRLVWPVSSSTGAGINDLWKDLKKRANQACEIPEIYEDDELPMREQERSDFSDESSYVVDAQLFGIGADGMFKYQGLGPPPKAEPKHVAVKEHVLASYMRKKLTPDNPMVRVEKVKALKAPVKAP
jgi:hypothetical protein